ncbi:MAG: UDP-N-acetylmuramate--L-alanine ligase [Rubrivivax sp.]|nr:UDP-N-acetylmuramate--L-alanine ligase [Rubrivivax sp.]
MKHALQHIHFVGIGGAGMSGIAEILHRQGFRVSGSDQAASAVTRRLAELGVDVHIGHDAAHIEGAQAVVTSTAVAADNPEVQAARAQRIPVVARAVLLAELMRFKQGIAIAGTHGKTTTTSLVASVLSEAGLDPTFLIGGSMLAPRPPQAATAPHGEPGILGRPGEARASAGANARLGRGEHIVVEADESDASFLHLNPVLGVVTNIDADHMATYGHDLSRLHGAFVDFIHRLPFYGRVALCSDDAGVQAILPRIERPVTTYGLNEGADLRAVQVQALEGGRMQFVVQRRGASDLPVTLNLAGVHNVCNALAAIAVAMALQLPDAPMLRALAQFAGVGRRFERHGEMPARDGGTFTLIDDYGHHPVELAAVLAAARGAFPGRRLVLVFQPHRYSRTADCFGDFVAVMQGFDAVLLTEVYAAGEAPIAGADGRALAQALRQAGRADVVFVADVTALPAAIQGQARGGDVVITMGAGSIGGVPRQLLDLAEVAR